MEFHFYHMIFALFSTIYNVNTFITHSYINFYVVIQSWCFYRCALQGRTATVSKSTINYMIAAATTIAIIIIIIIIIITIIIILIIIIIINFLKRICEW